MYSNSRVVKVEAKPEPINVDIARTALFVIDMQNDFASKGGLFDLAGIDISMNQKTVESTKKVLATARQAGMKIIYTKMEYSADLADLGPFDSPNRTRHLAFSVGKTIKAPDGRPSRLLVKGTWNTEIIPELAPMKEDAIISKRRYSAFFQTDLDSVLKSRGVRYLVFTGCTTSVCVESTVRDAMFRDYSCILLEDCCAEPIGFGLARSNHDASLLVIERLFGWVSNSEKFTKAVSKRN